MIYKAFMFVALWIGLASIFAAFDTIQKYLPRARLFFKNKEGRDMTGFLIAGVVVAMLGNLAGNIYWQTFWLLEWYGWPGSRLVQDIGLGFNAVFRNGGLLLGAYFFSRAFLIAVPGHKGKDANRFVIKTLGAGFVLSALLMAGRALL